MRLKPSLGKQLGTRHICALGRARYSRSSIGTFNYNRGFNMSVIAWIVLGLIAGFVASKIVNKSGEGMILDIILGIVGAVIGGFLFEKFGMAGVTGINLYSILVAVVGAIIFLVIYHALFRRGARV
jgi:uncharacterized membrane protein YeaQ/YmgE (transglycosylase-associated protein family)